MGSTSLSPETLGAFEYFAGHTYDKYWIFLIEFMNIIMNTLREAAY
jgi:hypothetical protein